jgi:hypothetical protein
VGQTISWGNVGIGWFTNNFGPGLLKIGFGFASMMAKLFIGNQQVLKEVPRSDADWVPFGRYVRLQKAMARNQCSWQYPGMFDAMEEGEVRG